MDQRIIAAVLQALPVAALAVDRRARVIAANAAAEALLGARLVDRPFVTALRHPAINLALEHVLRPARTSPPDFGLAGAPAGGVRLRATLGAASSTVTRRACGPWRPAAMSNSTR